MPKRLRERAVGAKKAQFYRIVLWERCILGVRYFRLLGQDTLIITVRIRTFFVLCPNISFFSLRPYTSKLGV